MDNSVLVTTMWIFFLSVMIVFPFIGTSDRRTVCRRRIVERRWNVEMRNDDSGAVDSVNAQRYDPDDIRFRCTDDEREDLRKKGLIKKFEQYTKKITEDDFASYDKQDFESCKVSYHSKLDDESLSLPSTRSPFIKLASYLSFSDISKKSEYGSRSTCDEVEIISKGKDITYGDDDASISHDEEDISLGSFSIMPSLSELSLSRASSRQAQLVIPPAGVSLIDYDENNLEKAERIDSRVVPGECSICLAEYEIGDSICWSSFGHCKHVYHQDCIIQWFLASAKTEDGTREDGGDSSLRQLMSFRTSCPNCRQTFI